MGDFVKFPFRQSFCFGNARLIAAFLFVFIGVSTFGGQIAPLPKTPEPPDPKISERVADELIVRFKPGATEEKKSKALKKARGVARDLIRPNAKKMIAADKGGGAAEELKVFKAEGSVEQAKAALEKDPDVLYVEPNYKTRVFAPIIPDDFEFESLYGLYNTGANGGFPRADIHAPEAWDITKGSRDIIVAVVDTGIDFFHEDLRSNIWVNTKEIPGNGIDDDGNGYVDDVYGFDFVSNDNDPFDDHFHGTHVAGTIGAMGNNGLGVVGVNWNVRIMAVKAFDEQGGGTVSAAIGALHYAVVNGARIINCSWGLEDHSRALADAIAEAQAAGVLVVAAAGNSRTDAPFYPAAYDSVIAVASVNNKGQRSNFSNFGAHVDISAPGEQILSTVPDSKYDTVSGTSMAAPHVSGVAALVLSRHPDFNPLQVATILKNTADPVSSDRPIGRGRVNAFEAAKIELPLPNALLQVSPVLYGPADFRGTASGARFQKYSLFHGDGEQPTTWTEFATSTTPVNDGLLFSGFDTSTLNDGTHTFKLVVYNDNGQFASELVTTKILNVQITSPQSSDIIRFAEPLVIHGTVFGQGRHYGVEWAKGMTQTEWHREGVTVPSNGEVVNGVLATFDTSLVSSNEFYSFRVSATNAAGQVQRHYANFVWLDSRLRAGWPVYLPFNGSYSFDDWRQAKVADLDGDGHKEILIVDHGNSDGRIARLLVYHDDGTLYWSRDLNSQEPYTDVPTVGDMDGDGKLEVFVDVGPTLYAFTYDGKDYPGLWPLTLTANRLGKIIADLDGDGKPELIALANNPPANNPNLGVNLTVYNKDGLILQRWTMGACGATNFNQRIFPVAANMDDDPDLEIVTVNACTGLSLFKFNHPDPIWYTSLVGTFINSPIVADVDHDGFNDIVVAGFNPYKGSTTGVYLIDRFGQIAPGWPTLVDDSFETPPAVGDLDGDGKLEIVVAGGKSYKLHVLESDGFESVGWPTKIDHLTTLGTPSVGDIDGDGIPEVIYTAPGYIELAFGNNDPKWVGGINVWRANGSVYQLSGRFAPIPIEGVATPGFFKASPVTLTDIDGNGKLDLVCASIREGAYAPIDQEAAYKDRSSIYIFELNAPLTHGLPDFPEFQHGANNNGFVPTAPPPPAPPEIIPIPEQIVAIGQAFTPISLDQFLFFPGAVIHGLQWIATGQTQLRVDIDTNHVATISAPPGWEGSEEITFTVGDGKSFAVSTKTRFTARAGFFPPIGNPDVAQLNEDETAVIDVLANDTNPVGGALTLLDVTKPSHGKALITPDAKILYTPDTNYAGADSFSYYFQNLSGARGVGLVTLVVKPVNDAPIAKDDRALTFEDHAVIIDVLANDIDPDGDKLQIVSVTQPVNAITTITSDNKISFAPRSGYNGTSVFFYTITDGLSAPQTASITVVVRPLNSAPVAKGQDLVMNRNTTKDIIYLADDIDGDPVTFRILQAPLHGELFSYPTVGSYTPRKGFSGVDTFTYKASDGFLESAEATIRITILNTNNPPTAPGLTFTTRVNQSAPITLQGSDADDDPIAFRISQPPGHGVLTGSGTNFVFTPTRDYLGNDSFLYAVSDGVSETIGKVTIQTTDKNTAPGANPKLLKTTPNTPVSFTLTGADAESNPLSFALTSQPKHGALTGTPPNLVYLPDTNYLGPDRFRFNVSDGEFFSDPAAVTIAIAAKNTIPFASNQVVVATTAGPIPMRLDVRDPDGDPLQCVILKGPRAGKLAGVGTDFVFTPAPGFGGVDVFTYKAWDGHNYGNEATVRIEQSIQQPPPPAPPLFNGIQVSAAGVFQLSLTNQVGLNFRLESSGDLTNWKTVTNVTSAGIFLYSVPSTNQHIFFRAVDE
jgi:subtilisin family serine protease